jgi:putative ABC transport system permease protein
MTRIALTQMRLSLGRLLPAGVAVALGSAFVAFALIVGNVLTESAYAQVAARLAEAGLVVTSFDMFDAADLQAARQVAEPWDVEPLTHSYVVVGDGEHTRDLELVPVTSDPGLNPLVVVEGRAPSADDEVALPISFVDRWDVEVGQEVTVTWWRWTGDGFSGDGSSGEDSVATGATLVTVVGLTDDPSNAFVYGGGAGLATLESIGLWSAGPNGALGTELLVGSDDSATAAALADVLPYTVVQTRDQWVEQQLSMYSTDVDRLALVVLGFAAIALIVASLVVVNTFQVLVAQQIRVLAVLRCLGARRGQIRAMAAVQGVILGILSSVVGMSVGLVVSELVLVVVAHLKVGLPVPQTLPMTPEVLWLPVLVGTAVTVVSSLEPVRRAGRVSPTAALRPPSVPSEEPGRRWRVLLAFVLVAVGAVLEAGASAAAVQGADSGVCLVLGVLGSASMFFGVTSAAVLWVPMLVAALGRLVGPLGAPVRIAVANARRNPRRAAATSTALLIGVTLVVTMGTGAATARRSLAASLDETYLVDVEVWAYGDRAMTSPEEVMKELAAVDGVTHVAMVRLVTATVCGVPTSVYAVDAADARAVLRDHGMAQAVIDGAALMPPNVCGDDEASFRTARGSVSVPVVPRGGYDVIVNDAVMDELDPTAVPSGLWISLGPDASAGEVLADVQDIVGDKRMMAMSGAAERESYENLIFVLLAIALGLLAVAVVIAVVGVANTLSLSVLERRRESATMRAIGMTRRQLRTSLAVEGTLMALSGTLGGVVLGVIFGWVGSAAVFGPRGSIQLTLPSEHIVAVVVGAFVAGAVASVLPSRAAARVPPVDALVDE